jgi:ApeA N-terminal domain 1
MLYQTGFLTSKPMSVEIDFSGRYSYPVQVNHDDLGDLGEATLLFGADHWPQLRFENWQAYDRLGDGKKYERMRATTKDGETFTLLDCSVTGFHLSIDYIVAGDVTAQFKSICIRFNDITEWFMPFRGVEEKIKSGSGNSDRYKQISATITADNQSFNLSSSLVLRVSKSGEDHIVHEHILFTFERTDGFFTAKDLKKKSHELSTLLSILIAVPLYLVNVLVVCDDGSLNYAFFASLKNKGNNLPPKNWADYFITKPLLDGRWQAIFQNYYESEFRAVSWVRLAGMQHYEGFWEYEALGYVSLLDRYVDQRAKGIKKIPSKVEDIKDTKVHAALQEISPQLTVEQENSVFAVMVKYFMNSKKLFFRDKYNYVAATMDNSIRSIINLSYDDFEKIKDIRDAIAHGDAPDLVETDYERVGIIVNKIALLLTYWSFIDFGLTNEDFLKCLTNHNPMRLRADIDRIGLQRVTKSAGFFRVSKDTFDRFSQIKGIKVQGCFRVDGNGGVEYAEEHVTALKIWRAKRLSGEIPVAQIFGRDIEKIKCWGEAYIECGSERLELIQAYFIQNA